MSENRAEPTFPPGDVTHGGDTLPHHLRGRFNGQLDGQQLIAWAQYDLDEENRYTTRYAILTDRALLLLAADGNPHEIRIGEIAEAKVVEGLGVDHMSVITRSGERFAELRYTMRHRRGMTR